MRPCRAIFPERSGLNNVAAEWVTLPAMPWDDHRHGEFVETMILLSRRGPAGPARPGTVTELPWHCAIQILRMCRTWSAAWEPQACQLSVGLVTMLCGHMSVCAACGGAVSSVSGGGRGGGGGVTAGLSERL